MNQLTTPQFAVLICNCAVFCCVNLCGSDLRSEEAEKSVAAMWSHAGQGLIKSHCLDCHNESYSEAEVDLSGFADVSRISGDQRLWQRVVNIVKFGAMPPADAEMLDDDQRAKLVDSLEQVLHFAACSVTPQPGKVTARRLNRAEYDNTVSDLFGFPIRVSDTFPSDEVGAGFDNNADVLSIPPMLFEKYMSAAEEVAQKVIFDPRAIDRSPIENASDQIITEGDAWVGSFTQHFMAAETFAWTEIKVPYTGRYKIDFHGGAFTEDQQVTIGVFDADGILLHASKFKYFGGGGGSQRDTFRLDLPKGASRFLFALLPEDQDFEPGVTRFANLDQLDDERIAAGRQAIGRRLTIERNLDKHPVAYMVRKLSLTGPEGNPPELIPASHHKILITTPDRKVSVGKAARECLGPLLRLAFRSPVDDATIDKYAKLAEMAHDREGSFEAAMRVAVSAILVSPRFLFRVEVPPDGTSQDRPSGVIALTDHQLASRLSYFLWSSMPDHELLQLADEGQLADESVLKKQVLRMLGDPRSSALATDFASQWLGLRILGEFEPDKTRYPEFDDELRAAMQQETLLLFQDLMRENRPITDLLISSGSFVNERLAKHYGIDDVEGEEFRWVSLENHHRQGILTHASILTLTSYPGRTSPVLRGKWLLENILGTPPPDPPPGVPELEETAGAQAGASLREQFEAHRTNPTCASCHSVMDELGFGLENFGPIGNYRVDDNGHAIDASGVLPGGRHFDGVLPLVKQLFQTESQSYILTVTNRLLTYALGRELTPADRCFVADIVSDAADHDYRFAQLVTAVVLSKPFRFYSFDEN